MSRKVGAIIVRDKSIISTGYNGPPSGYPHCECRDDKGVINGSHVFGEWNDVKLVYVCPRTRMNFKSGEGLEYCPAIHAEVNAILQAAREGISIVGSSLYLNTGITPCRECAKAIVGAGVKEVVLNNQPILYDKSGITGMDLLNSCHVKVRYNEENKSKD